MMKLMTYAGAAIGVAAMLFGAYLLGVSLFDNDTVCFSALDCVTVEDTEQKVMGGVAILVGALLLWRAVVALRQKWTAPST